MVNALFSWPVIGTLVAIFIGIGNRAMGITSSSSVAKICFSVAGLIFLIKFGIWISSETFELKWRITVAFVIFGIVGLGWVLSWHWVNKLEKEEAKKAYVGRLQPEKRVILSGEDNIYPELEIGDSGAVLVWGGAPGEPMFKIAKDNEIKIELVNGEIEVSTKILGSNGQMVAEIVDNEWKVKPHNTWDRNYTKNALEVRDPAGDIVLQVRLVGNRVQFQAKLFDEKGQGFMVWSEKPQAGGFMQKIDANHPERHKKIKPIFKYPSELHLGEFVESQ